MSPAINEQDDLQDRADAGDAQAQYDYALQLCLTGDADDRSVLYLEQAANQGLLDAIFELGVVYEEGFGVPVNEIEAARLFEATLASSSSLQPHPLAVCLNCVLFLEDASSRGHWMATRHLGLCYADGRGTFPKIRHPNNHPILVALKHVSHHRCRERDSKGRSSPHSGS